MTGADALLAAAAAHGLGVCFVNPGTTELSVVAALERTPAIRPILVLHEGVAAGAADGYARMTGAPALAMVHLGPSLGNAIANLHNARRAGSPVIVVVGDHPAGHRACDPPLASDIEGLAGPVSAFVRRVHDTTTIAQDLAAAVAAARAGHVATLVVPADVQWSEATPSRVTPVTSVARAAFEPAPIAAVLRDTGRAGGLLLGGATLGTRGLHAAGRIARATGCRLVVETFPARLEGGVAAPALERLAYVPALARTQLAALRTLVLVGAARPLAYFAEPGEPSDLVPSSTAVRGVAGDPVAALEAIGAALGAPTDAPSVRTRATPPRATAKLAAGTIVETIAALQPDDIVFVDEGVSAGGAYLRVAPHAPPHSYLALTGGATGWGLPCAIGAAVACPARKVVAFVGDGSAMYAVQALWTMAREALDIVVIVLANAEYRILQLELTRRTGALGPVGRALTELRAPRVDWIAMARAMGVDASLATTTDGFASALAHGFRERGPHLIEARI